MLYLSLFLTPYMVLTRDTGIQKKTQRKVQGFVAQWMQAIWLNKCTSKQLAILFTFILKAHAKT